MKGYIRTRTYRTSISDIALKINQNYGYNKNTDHHKPMLQQELRSRPDQS